VLPIFLLIAALGHADGHAQTPAHASLARWIDVQAATLSARMRKIETSAGVVTSRDLQHSDQLRVRAKLDSRNRYAIVAGAATGETFTSNWLNTGAGIGTTQWKYSVKQFYASVSPVRGLEGQYGGIVPVRGESTEITTYDNDGYLEGGRVSVRRPKTLFFDDVTATMAYLGDLTTPNVFERLHRLGDLNFYEVLVSKRAGASVRTSGAFTSVDSVCTVRGAITISGSALGPIDLLRVEAYRRTTDSTGGYALYAERKMGRGVTAGGGWADIDRHYGGLNADRFNAGRRAYLTVSVPVVKSLTAQFFAAHAAHNSFPVSNAVRVEALLVWNVKEAFAPRAK
jgi:hypothetical protein